MNVFADFLERVLTAVKNMDLKSAGGDALDLDRVSIETPKDPLHGDLATNVSLVLAKQVGMSPRELAKMIGETLAQDADIEEINVAGPGFINIKLSASVWFRVLNSILWEGGSYGSSQAGQGRKVNVEYVSANPTGPLHVGHCRGAVFGDALANLLAFAGWDVVREYYINDAGEQIVTLAETVFLRYREALGEDIGDIPKDLYPGDYLIPVGAALAERYGEELLAKEGCERLGILKQVAIEAMMKLIREDLETLDIRHDVFFSERSLHEKVEGEKSEIEQMLENLENQNLVYLGKLPPPKGRLPDDWEDREQLLFRAT